MFSCEEDVTKAELMRILALADNNIPFRHCDAFLKLLTELCPDSKIARSFAFCRTKISYIIRNTFGQIFDEELKVEFKGTFVFLGLDESIDTIDDKQLEINVSYYNESKREVVTYRFEHRCTAHTNVKESTDHIVKL